MKFAARACSVVLIIPLAASADTLWRQYGFDAPHTSYNKQETILTKSNIGRLGLFWTSDTFRAPGSAPILGFAAVFVANDGRVRALDEQTGVRRWARLSCTGEGTQQPAFGRQLLLVGDSGGDLAAYE